MEILAEGALDKALVVPEKVTDTKQPCKTVYLVIDNDYFEQYSAKFPK